MTAFDPARSGVSWAVRPSLLQYVGRSGGLIEVTPPASAHDAGFSWPVARLMHDPATGALRVGLDGAVRLSAHEGLLDVPLGGLELHIADGVGQLLTQADPTAPVVIVHGEARAVPAVDGVTAWVLDEPALHADVVDWFGGQYPAGAPFAPLMLALAHSAVRHEWE